MVRDILWGGRGLRLSAKNWRYLTALVAVGCLACYACSWIAAEMAVRIFGQQLVWFDVDVNLAVEQESALRPLHSSPAQALLALPGWFFFSGMHWHCGSTEQPCPLWFWTGS